MKRLAGAICLWWLLLIGAADASPDPAGVWVMSAEGRVAAILTLSPDPKEPGGWRADRTRPAKLDILMSHRLIEAEDGAPRTSPLRFLQADGGRLLFAPPDDPSDVVSLRLIGPDVLAYSFGSDTAGFEPLLFRRAAAKPELARGWVPGRRYVLDSAWPSNPAVKAIFDADQADRRVSPRDRETLIKADTARREAARKLLDAGELRSGEDFYHAAFVFQHGGSTESYLLAHALATASAARGHRPAAWLAAATLDRYLLSIGRSQVYGTQFSGGEAGTLVQPFDRSALPDAVRVASGVEAARVRP